MGLGELHLVLIEQILVKMCRWTLGRPVCGCHTPLVHRCKYPVFVVRQVRRNTRVRV